MTTFDPCMCLYGSEHFAARCCKGLLLSSVDGRWLLIVTSARRPMVLARGGLKSALDNVWYMKAAWR